MPERSSDNPLLRCDFCGRRPKGIRKIIAGPGQYICEGCVRLAGEGTALDTVGPDEPVACSFCGRARSAVLNMVVRNDVRICGECLDLCREILDHEGVD